MHRAVVVALVAGLGVALTACEQVKSANPLNPSVAGPIPGVNITAPLTLEPAAGAEIVQGGEPVTLLIQNRRVRVPRLYDPLYEKPPPLVPRERRFEVPERIGAAGDVVVALDEAAVEGVARQIAADHVDAVAVCFLNSFANPAHERRAGEIIGRILPHCFVTLSVDLLPQIREYERTSSTVINAYVGPPVKSYLETMIAGLARARESGGHVAADDDVGQHGRLLDQRAVLDPYLGEQHRAPTRPRSRPPGGPSSGPSSRSCRSPACCSSSRACPRPSRASTRPGPASTLDHKEKVEV